MLYTSLFDLPLPEDSPVFPCSKISTLTTRESLKPLFFFCPKISISSFCETPRPPLLQSCFLDEPNLLCTNLVKMEINDEHFESLLDIPSVDLVTPLGLSEVLLTAHFHHGSGMLDFLGATCKNLPISSC